ncbi:hypothetical protein AB0H63_13575 [Micromonospora echinospora]|uniref:hypothetical protein n=1 Tax=Micromonospora echinospora TaxID=1877 RepID=UPI003404BFE7
MAETMEALFMDSLLADLNHPAIEAFLDAVDEVMNSNTLMLKVRADVPVQPGNRAAILSDFLRAPLFHEMMLTADRARGWWMFHEMPYEPTAAAPIPAAGAPGSLVRDGFRLTLSPLDGTGMAARLRWMLTSACSPYRRHLDENRARDLAGEFLRHVFDSGGGLCPVEPDRRSGTETPWEFCTVRPDFLRGMDEHADEPYQPAYFEGCESADTATFFHQGEVFYLLLTNGAP